jgi:hypothetical protein
MDMLLCLALTRRELSVLLLVVRLTYGCRNARWARLRQSDLAAVGIGPNHAKETLDALLAGGLLIRNGAMPEYRLGELEGAADRQAKERAVRLEGLVAAQVAESSRNGKVGGQGLPETGTRTFPFQELSPYRNGNASTVPAWSFDRSQGRFLQKEGRAIDNDRQ